MSLAFGKWKSGAASIRSQDAIWAVGWKVVCMCQAVLSKWLKYGLLNLGHPEDGF